VPGESGASSLFGGGTDRGRARARAAEMRLLGVRERERSADGFPARNAMVVVRYGTRRGRLNGGNEGSLY
jgi:hypothetical protein